MPAPDDPFAPGASITTLRLRGLVQAGLAYAMARGKLFQIEAQEAGQHASQLGLTTGLAAGSLIGAWLLLLPAIVSLTAKKLDQPWEYVALALGVLHLIISLLLLQRVKARLPQLKLFEESLNQFQKDREWIAGNQLPPQH
jgi:threonine/homoserine efflux transporter RhtA